MSGGHFRGPREPFRGDWRPLKGLGAQDRSCPDTLLRFTTDEALFREAMEDPLLERYSVIVLDEAAQRSMCSYHAFPFIYLYPLHHV